MKSDKWTIRILLLPTIIVLSPIYLYVFLHIGIDWLKFKFSKD